ncbi:hypothetical protein Hanom_Chr15g01362701 [Helianthus anomalus]
MSRWTIFSLDSSWRKAKPRAIPIHMLNLISFIGCSSWPALGVGGEDHRPGPDILKGTFF